MFPRALNLTIALPLFMYFSTAVHAADKPVMLFDFSKPAVASEWKTVNDNVMGGVSEGRVGVTENALQFYGSLSLENNGGFASARSPATRIDLSKYDGLIFRIRGDGRDYYLNVRVPTEQIAFSYRASFKTEQGKWMEVRMPFADLQPTSFGRIVENAEAFNPGNVESLGFLLADKKAGPFKLEIAWIKGSPRADKAAPVRP